MSGSKTKTSGPSVSRRAFLGSTSAMACGSAMAVSRAGAAASARSNRPNILIIITDQQHLDSISAGGCDHVRTPAMDQLVHTGVTFRQSYCANPVCSPSRAAILTGRPSSETGVYVNNRSIRSNIPNLGQWLAEVAGYEAVYAGKWHLPRSYSATIPGFRVLHTGIGGQGNVCDPAVSMACEAFLRNRTAAQPFLMVASFMQPHDICEWLRLNRDCPSELRYPDLAHRLPPLPDNHHFDAREPETVRGTRQRNEPAQGGWDQRHWRYYRWSYYRHIEMVDGEVGRLLGALGDAGRHQDTLVVFTADHGEGMGHHQMVRKSSPYDEALRVPLMLSLPGRVRQGLREKTCLTSGLDIVPTCCDFAGVEPPANMRGQSLRLLREGQAAAPRRCIVSESNSDTGRTVRSQRYKYVTYRGDPVEMLFDLQTDPGEVSNLAQDPDYADIAAEHRQMLIQWERQLDVAPGVPKSDAWWRKA